MKRIRLGLVGYGKIAQDQHIPAIASNPDIELVAVASLSGQHPGLPNFISLEAMLEAMPELDAIVLCTPASVRYQLARTSLLAGKHVFLEKPPGATLSEVAALARIAEEAQRTLFASWHSRYAEGVAKARAWLADRSLTSVRIDWKEDVRKWHPGQDWIFQPGGLGVFDPGINALSIATHILPQPFFLQAATLAFPANRQAPIAAKLDFVDADALPIRVEFDFLQQHGEVWEITVSAADGELTLSKGGAVLSIDGQTQEVDTDGEYPLLYRTFAGLIDSGQSDVDVDPLRHVADAFMLGRREEAEAFEW